MGSNGIDVSADQKGLLLRGITGLEFVLAKATEGVTISDDTYAEFAEQTEALGANFGAYHFFHAENLNARRQADWFMTHAKPRSLLSLWIDYETYGASAQADAEEIGYFIDEVKVSFPKAKVGIYTNDTGLGRIYPYLPEIPFNGFWWANPSQAMEAQATSLPWQIHQYKTLNGIDRNYSTWSHAEFAEYWTW